MKCGVTDTESCLKAVTLALSEGMTVSSEILIDVFIAISYSWLSFTHYSRTFLWCRQVIKVDSSGNLEINRIISQMPFFTGNLHVDK